MAGFENTSSHGLFRFYFAAILGLVILACSPLTSVGQSATATLTGTVVDDKDAVVPGVEVTIINPVTGLRRTTKTSDEGFYSFPALAPGIGVAVLGPP